MDFNTASFIVRMNMTLVDEGRGVMSLQPSDRAILEEAVDVVLGNRNDAASHVITIHHMWDFGMLGDSVHALTCEYDRCRNRG